MKNKHHTPEQIIKKLRRVEALKAQGKTIGEAVKQIEVSERRACKVLGQPRSTQRYQSTKPAKDKVLTEEMHELARENPRFGYRRITELVRLGGQRINEKRIHRLWKQAGLQVPIKKRKRRRVGTSKNGSIRLEATHPKQVWSYDFVYDRTEDGRQLKLMPIIDEFTRECHAIEVGRSITSREVIYKLEELFELHGRPAFIRSDNGPEFLAEAVMEYLKEQGTETQFIDPGAPWQNSHVESFNGKLRDELLDRELFTTLLDARVLVEQYRKNYNEHRPHSALGYKAPSTFAAAHTRQVNQESALALT